MFIERFRRSWWKRLRRDVEPRRCVWHNDQLGRSVGNGGIFFNQREHGHGRKQLGRPVLDGRKQLGWPALHGRCYRLGWLEGNGRGNGWNDSRAIGRYDRLGWLEGNGRGNGWNDSRAIGRCDRLRREVGDWWAHRNWWRCDCR